MKINIGKFSIDLNNKIIVSSKKEEYIKTVTKNLAWTKIDPSKLTEAVTVAYETVKPPKKRKPSL